MTRPQSIPARRWHVLPVAPDSLQRDMPDKNPVLLQVLYNRGLTDPKEVDGFINGRYLQSTDPFLLPDMDKAVERIKHAIENEQIIVVYGDFDADGVTSTVLLIEALRGLGINRRNAQPYIPDRVDEGYGLNNDALTHIRDEIGADLVITVDCGIRSVAEVEHANSIGLDMIVTDHHSIGDQMPPALAIINPKRADSAYPETMLAGVGIAYKLVQALQQHMPDRVNFNEADLLDLVAIGTVADLAPLLGENRQLVKRGLVELNKVNRPGIGALMRLANLKRGKMTAESIGFGIGPRINAAGRLAKAYTAAKLLIVNNDMQAGSHAQDLEALNKERRSLTKKLTDLADELVDPTDPILIANHEDFVGGVVGLVASSLANKHYRPAIVMERGEAFSRGSCRSIPEFHVTQALESVSDILERFGGHAQAAGFTVANENLDEFSERLKAFTTDKLGGLDLIPSITIDTEIEFSEINFALYESLQKLEPTGYANATAVFVSRNVHIDSFRAVGSDASHLQLMVTDGKNYVKGIAFRQGAWVECMPKTADIVFKLSVNEWRGETNLQLMVEDIWSRDED